MSFNITNLNAIESVIEADLENPLNENNNFQITDLTISESVNQIYLQTLNTNSFGFQIFDLEIDDAIQTYYSQESENTVTETLYTSITNGPYTDSGYIFLKQDNLPYLNLDPSISTNPDVFKLPENTRIKNISFLNINGPIPVTTGSTTVINFNYAFNTIIPLFPIEETRLSDFNVSKSPITLPNITDNIYFVFVASQLLNPSQIKMTITYTI